MMKRFGGDRELILEIGLGAVGLGLLSGLAALVLGRVLGDRRRGARHAEGPPLVGSVPPERHQNLSSSPR